jgi:hypothetical protein
MANNCVNTITIQKNKLTKIFEKRYLEIKDKEKFSLFKVMANMEVKDTGQKWDVDLDEANIEIEKDEIIMCFDTAWSPCLDFSQKVSELYQTEVEHSYEESGMDFGGFARFVSGERLEAREVTNLKWVFDSGDDDRIVDEIQLHLEGLETNEASDEEIEEYLKDTKEELLNIIGDDDEVDSIFEKIKR